MPSVRYRKMPRLQQEKDLDLGVTDHGPLAPSGPHPYYLHLFALLSRVRLSLRGVVNIDKGKLDLKRIF